GTAEELATLRRMFAIMGMYPVSYYDLSQAGVPVHSTAFRPIDDAALARNPFRVFTSLLRLELIANEALRQRAADILSRRDIFTSRCRELIALHEQQGEFTAAEAREFVQQALETFRWHRHATVDEETYHALHEEHRLIADVVCFPGCHINHLTPRTLDIDRVQALMPECGIAPKALIEGPPRRDVPILLRQTSFKALEEPVMFAGEHRGTHTARFGEIEQRGIALTPKGRALYDRLLGEAGVGKDNLTHQRHLQEVFSPFPDSEFLLRQQGLAYFRYRLTPAGEAHRQAFRPGDDPQPLIERGWVIAQPIIYEDFLPVSAAGIFQSNLGNEIQTRSHGNASRQAFEEALGCPVYDEFALYQQAEERSKRRCGLL
ncbi:VOC family protein, partial [Klebsiella michiganensis]